MESEYSDLEKMQMVIDKANSMKPVIKHMRMVSKTLLSIQRTGKIKKNPLRIIKLVLKFRLLQAQLITIKSQPIPKYKYPAGGITFLQNNNLTIDLTEITLNQPK